MAKTFYFPAIITLTGNIVVKAESLEEAKFTAGKLNVIGVAETDLTDYEVSSEVLVEEGKEVIENE